MTKKNRFVLALILLAVFSLILIILSSLRTNEFAVQFFSNFSNSYGKVVGKITASLSFSLFEFIICTFIVVGLIFLLLIIINFKNRQIIKALTKIVSILIVVVLFSSLYVATASFSYFKPRIDLELDETYFKDDVEKSIKHYYKDFYDISELVERDELGNLKMPYSDNELANLVRNEFLKLDFDFLYDFVPSAKGLKNSWFITANNIIGIYFAPTLEANYTTDTPKVALPFTIAHELCHGLGVMNETDANLLSTYVLLQSDNIYLRYSVYFDNISILESNNVEMTFNKEYFKKEIVPFIVYNEKYNYDFEQYIKFWNNKNGLFSKIGAFFNDLYLKLSGIKDGSNSYYEKPPPVIIVPPTIEGEKPEIKVTYSDLQKVYFDIYKYKIAK